MSSMSEEEPPEKLRFRDKIKQIQENIILRDSKVQAKNISKIKKSFLSKWQL